MMQNTISANKPITIPMMAPVGSLEVPSDTSGADGSPVNQNIVCQSTWTDSDFFHGKFSFGLENIRHW